MRMHETYGKGRIRRHEKGDKVAVLKGSKDGPFVRENGIAERNQKKGA